jgi:hypothetical protein
MPPPAQVMPAEASAMRRIVERQSYQAVMAHSPAGSGKIGQNIKEQQ